MHAGGALVGHYTAYYHTAAQAQQASATVSASVNRVAASGSAETSLSSEVAKTNGHYDTKTQYDAYGWNNDDKLPPKVCRSSVHLCNSRQCQKVVCIAPPHLPVCQ